ncbi:MAG: hypothetical protein AAF135_25310 [Bacteroidota bacterium]
MKHPLIYIFLVFHLVYGQTDDSRNRFPYPTTPTNQSIWDQAQTDSTLQVNPLSYDQIPRYLEFRGNVVEALTWEDGIGENILVQTVTGQFDWKDYLEDSSEYAIEDKSALHAYLFVKKKGEKVFQKIWRIYDFMECYGVDWYTGFIPQATTVTDVDQDGLSEISLPYVLVCRGGVDPGVMKIIMYEGGEKYALRGETAILCETGQPIGGAFKPSSNLENQSILKEFLIQRWEINKCEKGRFN